MDPQALLDGPGTVWWSADSLDRKGNGIGLSWGFGHPEARAGATERPARTVGSLEVVVFARGVPSFWLHQRFFDEATWWRGTVFRFGRSQIEMLQDMRARVVIARLDAQLPRGQRVEGTLEVAATPSDGAAPLWGETALLTGPGKGQGAITAHGRPFTVIGEGVITRSVFVDSDAARSDTVVLMHDHTMLLSGRETLDGWRTQATSIDRQGNVSDTLALDVDEGGFSPLMAPGAKPATLGLRHQGSPAFDLEAFAPLHAPGQPHGLWHAQALAPMEVARPSLTRVRPAGPITSADFVLDDDGRGSRLARRRAGAIGRKPGLLERLWG